MLLASKDLTLNDKLYFIRLNDDTLFVLGKLIRRESIQRPWVSDVIYLDVLLFQHMPAINLVNTTNIYSGFNPTGISKNAQMFSEVVTDDEESI